MEHSGGGSHGSECAELPYTHLQPPPHPLERMLAMREESSNSMCLPCDRNLLDTQFAIGDGGLLFPSALNSSLLEEQTLNLSSLMTNMSLTNHGVMAKKGFLEDSEVLCGTDVVLSSEGAVCLPSAGSLDLYKDIPVLI